MQERREAGKEGCRTGERLERRVAGKEGCRKERGRTGGMHQGWDSGHGMQYRWDGKKGIQDRREAGKEGCRKREKKLRKLGYRKGGIQD